MIDASLVYEYVLDFPEEILAEGVTRKYVNTLLYGRIFLHPSDPRFGCDSKRNLYSFRCPRGYSKSGTRVAAVHYGKPRPLNGHRDKKRYFLDYYRDS